MFLDQRARVAAPFYLGWALASVLFMVGFAKSYPPRSSDIEAFLVLCVLFAQSAAIYNFSRKPTTRNGLIITALLFWALGFVARRLELIDDGIYTVDIVVFIVAVVIINRTGGKRDSRPP